MHIGEFSIYIFQSNIHVLFLINSSEYNRLMILFLDKIKLVVFDLISLYIVILAKNTKRKTICKMARNDSKLDLSTTQLHKSSDYSASNL